MESEKATLVCPRVAGLGIDRLSASSLRWARVLYEAIADDGPLKGAVNLTVETPDGKWPHFAIWADDGGRHEYRLKHPPEDRALSASGAIPVYAYVRTLDVDEH